MVGLEFVSFYDKGDHSWARRERSADWKVEEVACASSSLGGMVSRGILSISWELRASVYSWEQGLEPTALFLSPVSSTQILGPYRGAGPRDIESRVVPTSNGRGTQERRSTQVST